MGLSLETKTLGGADAAFTWLLHLGGARPDVSGVLATIQLGDGTETRVGLVQTGLALISPTGHRLNLSYEGSSNASLQLGPAPTSVGNPASGVALASTVTTTLTTYTASGLKFTLEPNAKYTVRLVLILSSGASGNGVRIKFDGTSKTGFLWRTDDGSGLTGSFTDLSSSPVFTRDDFTGTSQQRLMILEGTVNNNTGSNLDFEVQLASETSGQSALLTAGSSISYFKQ